MKKTKTLITLLFLLSSNLLFSQEIEKRFKGGQEAFEKLIYQNLSYPLISRKNAVIGTSVTAFTIGKNGKLKKIIIINSLGEEIDKEVVRVTMETLPFWLEGENEITFTLPILFGHESTPIKRDNFTCDYLLDEIGIVAFGSNIPETDKKTKKNYEKALSKNNFDNAIEHISELIRRNPFNADYYKNRAVLLQKVNKTAEACQDLEKIELFLETELPEDININCE